MKITIDLKTFDVTTKPQDAGVEKLYRAFTLQLINELEKLGDDSYPIDVEISVTARRRES